MAVSSVGMHLGLFQHWYTTHPEFLRAWRDVRTQYFDVPDSAQIHCKQGGGVGVEWPIIGRFAGLSGESAAVVGCALGYDEITLAGLPADHGGHYYPEPIVPGVETLQSYGLTDAIRRWEWLRDNYFQGRVKSLSGNTREILC